jgi:hypothetical protein
MKTLAWLKTEPSVIIGLAGTGMACLIAFGVKLTPEQTGGVIAVIAAILAVIKAITVRPFYWPILSGVVSAGLSLGIAFGTHLTQDQVGTIMAVVVGVLGVFVRQAVTPETKLAPVNMVKTVPSDSAGTRGSSL